MQHNRKFASEKKMAATFCKLGLAVQCSSCMLCADHAALDTVQVRGVPRNMLMTNAPGNVRLAVFLVCCLRMQLRIMRLASNVFRCWHWKPKGKYEYEWYFYKMRTWKYHASCFIRTSQPKTKELGSVFALNCSALVRLRLRQGTDSSRFNIDVIAGFSEWCIDDGRVAGKLRSASSTSLAGFGSVNVFVSHWITIVDDTAVTSKWYDVSRRLQSRSSIEFPRQLEQLADC